MKRTPLTYKLSLAKINIHIILFNIGAPVFYFSYDRVCKYSNIQEKLNKFFINMEKTYRKQKAESRKHIDDELHQVLLMTPS